MVRAAAIAAASVTRKKSSDSSRSVLNSAAIFCLLCAKTIVCKRTADQFVRVMKESAAIVAETRSGAVADQSQAGELGQYHPRKRVDHRLKQARGDQSSSGRSSPCPLST